jgi:hypothetical protein
VHDGAHHVGAERAAADGRARGRRTDDPRKARLVAGQHGDDIEARKDTADTTVAMIANDHVPFGRLDHTLCRGAQRVAWGHRWCLRRDDLVGGRRAGQRRAKDVACGDQAGGIGVHDHRVDLVNGHQFRDLGERCTRQACHEPRRHDGVRLDGGKW